MIAPLKIMARHCNISDRDKYKKYITIDNNNVATEPHDIKHQSKKLSEG